MANSLIGAVAVARMLHVSRATVQRRALDGAIPYVAKAPGTRGAYLFDRDEIERLAAEAAR